MVTGTLTQNWMFDPRKIDPSGSVTLRNIHPKDRWPFGILTPWNIDPRNIHPTDRWPHDTEIWPHGILTHGIFIQRMGWPFGNLTRYQDWPTFSMDNLNMLFITWGLFLKTYNNRKMRFLCVGMILISLPAVQRLIVTLFLTTRC